MPMELNADLNLFFPMVGTTQAVLKSYEKGSGSVTFTRATTATRVNPDTGLIEAVASGEAREDGRDYLNMFYYSQEMEKGGWSILQSSIVAPGDVLSPDGKYNTRKIIEDSTTNYHYADHGVFFRSGGTYVYTLYIKKGNKTWCWMDFPTDALLTWFNFDTGLFGNTAAGVTASATSVGNGWWRITLIASPSNLGGQAGFGLASANGVASYAGNGSDYMYVFGAQVREGTAASRYVKSGSNPAYAPRGILIEGQRTNLFTYSEQLNDASWSATAVTVTANSVAAPDGNTTAEKIAETTANSYHWVTKNPSMSSSTKYTLSAFVQYGTRAWVYLVATAKSGTSYGKFFNLSTGAVGGNGGWSAPLSYTFEYVVGGWWRISITIDSATGATATDCSLGIASGDGTANYAGSTSEYMYGWGLQIEQGEFPTSYIPTTSATVTRNGESISIPTSGNISAVIGAVIMTAGVDYQGAGINYPSLLSLTSVSNDFLIQAYATNQICQNRRGVTPFYKTVPWGNISNKLGSRWNGVAGALIANGGSITEGMAADTFDGPGANMYIGSDDAGNAGRAHIKMLNIFSRQLSDSEMQAITTP